jgi:preprotein translocase subunit SecA
MLKYVINKIFGTSNERELKKYTPYVTEINALEPRIEKLSDEELRGYTARWRISW